MDGKLVAGLYSSFSSHIPYIALPCNLIQLEGQGSRMDIHTYVVIWLGKPSRHQRPDFIS